MKTALCLTPDLAFFRPAVRAAASLLAQADSGAFDVFIVCEAGDVAPGFDALDPSLRDRIKLSIVDFSRFDGGLAGRGRFSRAVFRRLFLDRVTPESYSRIVTMDSDMLVTRPGLARLADVDLRGEPIAAAYDMIHLMDFGGGALARRFQAHRRSLGLDLATPYFNAGLMVIDRAAWRAARLGERAVRALCEAPRKFPFMEQDALNAMLAGGFAPLSPRCNFMGDFFLLDLEATIAPIVLHFVNSPKPWEYQRWRGEARFAEAYRSWFAASPWPDWSSPAPAGRPHGPRRTAARRRFAERLTAFLAAQRFVDE
ncbi:MAG: glycosyltransferase family 8 protein [Roseiarcus sp.]